MATSVFFNNFQSSQEQLLIEDLILESIQIYGHDVHYLPREQVNRDTIYEESTISEFNSSHIVDMFIKNIDGFSGDGDFISKFGLEIRDRITFTVARRRFFNDVATEASIERPREGDLIYFPLNKKVFEIKFVEHEAIFYQLGALQTFDLVCELFEFSDEKFQTGISEIDELFVGDINYSLSLANFTLITEDSNPYDLVTESGYNIVDESFSTADDSEQIEEEADEFIDFSTLDPFSEGAY